VGAADIVGGSLFTGSISIRHSRECGNPAFFFEELVKGKLDSRFRGNDE
jgi:hypothetical protein